MHDPTFFPEFASGFGLFLFHALATLKQYRGVNLISWDSPIFVLFHAQDLINSLVDTG